MADRMEERMEGMGEEMGELPPEEEDHDSDREEDEPLFVWMVNDIMDDDDDEDEEEEDDDVEDEQPLNTEASESYELDSPAERSGHIAVVDRNFMYVWGGYKNPQNHGFFDLYLPRNEIWAYNMESGVWTRHTAGGNLHTSMSGSCGACVDGVLYLFGGHHARGNTTGYDIYRLCLRASILTWEEMRDLKGLAPTCKDKLGCWLQKNKLIFFGGYGYAAQGSHRGTFEYDESSSLVWDSPGRGWNNHIHILDLDTLTWSQPITTGDAPSPRAAHACATLGNRGYVFGGRFKNLRLNDLFYIDLDSWEWHEMSVPQQAPVGRSWHSFTPVSTEHIFLFGGFTTERETLSDAWLYCVSTNQWKPFKHGHSTSPRLWHTACSGLDGEVFVFGGCANNLLSHHRAAHSNELLVFNVQPKSLVGFCMEAVLQHRERLSAYWDCLPKHLLHSLKQRISLINTLGS
ncbi:kelch domain-containing protein 2 [Gouania willdenowi]|uniref:kelch domain-containing protein 2 n=1 Tax=Gouania willdenowi TaxID=441366 RepID=UPI0010569D64|nr:kelch domain-containing protein 2 [Gouania willdenowi]